ERELALLGGIFRPKRHHQVAGPIDKLRGAALDQVKQRRGALRRQAAQNFVASQEVIRHLGCLPRSRPRGTPQVSSSRPTEQSSTSQSVLGARRLRCSTTLASIFTPARSSTSATNPRRTSSATTACASV